MSFINSFGDLKYSGGGAGDMKTRYMAKNNLGVGGDNKLIIKHK